MTSSFFIVYKKKVPKSQSKINTPKTSQRYALLSVFDKKDITEFAKGLLSLGFQIISTGGTAKVLEETGIKVVPVQAITKNPESFDGRMKTISFQIESAILYDRTNPSHIKEAKKLGVKKIDVVVCNLYPFEETVKNHKVNINDAVENIDVGGPTMIRAAAKNFKNVLVAVDPSDYSQILENLRTGKDSLIFRKTLAAKAFQHLSFYDAQIGKFLSNDKFPKELTLPGRLGVKLRYGENPHQEASVYFEPNTNSPLRNLKKLTGRDLSYVNFTDIWAGFECVRLFKTPAAVVIKHNSPSGIALGKDSKEALVRAVEADPESAFGGVMVLNSEIDIKTAKAFADFKEENGVLVDIIAAPYVTRDAQEYIKKIRKSTGIYTFGKIQSKRANNSHIKFFDGGFIVQDWDNNGTKTKNWKIVTKKRPTKRELEQMKIAWKFIGRVKSNTIIIMDGKLPMTRGIGSGQTSRVRSVKIALEQAGKYAKGGMLASDSFFPFDDSVKLAAKAGISAIIQQGGSVNDKLSIEAADKAGVAMVLTNERKFWH